MKMHPGWTLYGAFGILYFFVNLWGIVQGFRDGSIQMTSEEDTVETRAAERWMLWTMFSGCVAQSFVWPLFLPISIRQVMQMLRGFRAPSFEMKQTRDPLNAASQEECAQVLRSLADWRTTQGRVSGSAPVVLALARGLAHEGRAIYPKWATKEVCRRLVQHLEWTFQQDPFRQDSNS